MQPKLNPLAPLGRRILLRRLEVQHPMSWDGICTFCGFIHAVHNAERLAPWVRANAHPNLMEALNG